jgi:hypothetical protein
MSSATVSDVGSVAASIMRAPQSERETRQTPVQSVRQMRLHRYWQYFRCQNYSERRYDWDGREYTSPEENDAIMHGGVIPPGFYEAQAHDIPLKFRKPDVPYYLAKVVVKRFNSLLFSAKRHPQVTCEDPLTTDWLAGFAQATRLWSRMLLARTYGGAMGSCAVGFKFVKGKPIVEVIDPRFATPEFIDKSSQELKRLEIRYMYVDEVRGPEGEWEEKQFWYRRVIDLQWDRVWPKVPVEDDEPDWNRARYVEKEHGLGEHPFVWIQNQPAEDDVDGDPDCSGAFEMFEAIDALQSQGFRGTKANCDPTTVVSSDMEFSEIRKGSNNALQVEKGGSVDYLEMTGTGAQRAIELAERFEEQALTVSACSLDRNEGGPSRTESEVQHNYSAMIDQADILREQYGESGVKKLLEKVLRAARNLTQVRVDRTDPNLPRLTTAAISLPKGKIKNQRNGQVLYYERELGRGEEIELVWPDYFTPGLDEINSAVDAAGKAKTAGVMDLNHCVTFLANYFSVESVQDVVDLIKAEAPKVPGGANFAPPGGSITSPHVSATEVGGGDEEEEPAV